ncbi:hypothetical protein [Paraburkholderia strydomiana]|uniref:hypothetical protein n=1 Tax=Paraburkholderia strydomiana TaxID=1245417 RepID=UPI0038B78B38
MNSTRNVEDSTAADAIARLSRESREAVVRQFIAQFSSLAQQSPETRAYLARFVTALPFLRRGIAMRPLPEKHSAMNDWITSLTDADVQSFQTELAAEIDHYRKNPPPWDVDWFLKVNKALP